MQLRAGRKVQAPKGPTNSSHWRNPWNKEVLAQNDRPWRGRPSARFEEIGGPLLGVRSVTVMLIYRGLPPTATIGSPLRGLLPVPSLAECLRTDFQNQVTCLKANPYGMSNYSSVSSVVCRMNNEIRADANLRKGASSESSE